MKLLVYTLYFLIGFVRAFSACFIIKHVFRWKLKKYLLFSFVFGGITLCFEIIPHLFSMPGLSLNDHYLCAIFVPLIWLMLTDLSVLLKKINYPGRSLLDYFFVSIVHYSFFIIAEPVFVRTQAQKAGINRFSFV